MSIMKVLDFNIIESCGQESFGGVDAVEYKRYFLRVYGHFWLIKGC